MCGVFGILRPTGPAHAEMAAMRAALLHRGPDGNATASFPGANLGHARLAIVDTGPNGAQPMVDLQRRAVITFNGEIHDHAQLRAECERAGLAFRSTSDTEVILNLYVLQGPGAFARLGGMFAFCLHDLVTGESFLVRDPMGIKPMYWARTPRGLAFASELKALVRAGLVERRVNGAALDAYLQLDHVPAPLCLVDGVRKLEAGEVLRVDPQGGTKAEFPFGADDVPVDEDRTATPRDLGALLGQCVRRNLVADVPVGVLLSGGIDSSLVAHAAASAGPGPLHAFSLAFDEPTFDERRVAGRVARHLGLQHHVEVLRTDAVPRLLTDVVDAACEPVADGSLLPMLALARHVRRHVPSVLSGDGADELFGGYPTHAAARVAPLLRALPSRALLGAAHRWLPARDTNLSLEYRFKKLLDGMHADPLVQNARWLGSFTGEDISSLRGHDGSGALLELLGGMSRHGLEALLRMDQRFYLQSVLTKVDRASMAVGLEVRVPFLDRAMVRFARALPARHKVMGPVGKVLARRWAAEVLPANVAWRPKKGFGAPLAAWFRGPLRELLRDALHPARVASGGLVDGTVVNTLVEEHLRGERDHRKKLFSVLSLVLWQDHHLDGTGALTSS